MALPRGLVGQLPPWSCAFVCPAARSPYLLYAEAALSFAAIAICESQGQAAFLLQAAFVFCSFVGTVVNP
jgi:hypothetical protein